VRSSNKKPRSLARGKIRCFFQGGEDSELRNEGKKTCRKKKDLEAKRNRGAISSDGGGVGSKGVNDIRRLRRVGTPKKGGSKGLTLPSQFMESKRGAPGICVMHGNWGERKLLSKNKMRV